MGAPLTVRGACVTIRYTMQTEPQLLYQTLFGAPIPPVVEERFLGAAAILDRSASPAELAAYSRAMSAGVDLEALELAARYTKRLPLLTRKLALMAYLAETIPANQDRYVNRRGNFFTGALHVAGAVVRTVGKMVIGLLALRAVRP